MSDHRPSPPDEDVLVLPAEARRALHPRRGGASGEPVTVEPAAAARIRGIVDGLWPDASALRATIAGLPEWAERAERYRAGEADPAGAAAVMTALVLRSPTLSSSDAAARHRFPDARDQSEFVDAWAGEHGLAFAACALVELGTIAARAIGGRGVRLRLRDGGELRVAPEAARRMRSLLATADDAAYRDAIGQLAGHRRTREQMALVSYLVPTRQDWLDECLQTSTPADEPNWWFLRHALSTPKHLATPGVLSPGSCPEGLLVTLADAAGEDALPLFLTTLDHGRLNAAERRRLLDVIALMPFDGAFQALIDRASRKYVLPALITAASRFPARALRLLPPAASRSRPIAALLTDHVRAHPDTVAALAPGLPTASRTIVTAAAASGTRVPEAGPDGLPRLLTEPPWTRPRKPARPIVVTDLAPPTTRRTAWALGEREAWATPYLPPGAHRYPAATDWPAVIEEYRAGRLTYAGLFAQGPEEWIRPLLAEWTEHDAWHAGDLPWLRHMAGRFGLDALPVLLNAAQVNPAGCGQVLVPFLDAGIAELMARWLARTKAARQAAVSWFGRHGVHAVPLLVPAALGRSGPSRRQAEAALRLLAADLGAEDVAHAARGLGEEAANAVEALVMADPLTLPPARVPKLPEWANPALLRQILLRGRERALPTAATGHVLTMLAMSKPGEPYAGISALQKACDPPSLAEFAWALFQRWERHGAPAKDSWALDQLGLLGDDATALRLAPVIRAWPGDGGHQKAVRGLDALAAIGTDIALVQLHGIAEHVRFKGLRARARDRITLIATARGLTPDRLADRLVPDFGLDADGSMTLDYGPRRFTVGFDETLEPFVIGDDGRRRTTLPKPAAGDDAALAAAAHQRFSAMRKVARTAAAEQIRRLERAMVTLRPWSVDEFIALFVRHPVAWHIARRLVWLAEDGRSGEHASRTATAFRLAEDRTPADVDDRAFPLPETATVRIAHPLDLDDGLPAWQELLDDYEILQPFPQLRRPTYALTEDEARADRLTRFEGVTARSAGVLALRHRGWERDNPATVHRPLPDGRLVMIDLSPGLYVAEMEEIPHQELRSVRLADRAAGAAPRRFGDLDPVTASEIIADLTALTGA
ncbi:DUF4132 domain-containing protein [Actinomadura fibrosa]|uniref:DUF4132 domain-containing protein n=1 Tax=Actinomadura fibrosa TaxID=111802 RepID=A0ABW2XL26_9ACTN|nr:DUF4132 domain-containing protein [Actinomadura fibrosa]